MTLDISPSFSLSGEEGGLFMNKTKILLYGDCRLRTPAQKIVNWDKNVHRVAQSMSYILSHNDNAAGLAANQIGANYHMFMYRYDEKKLVINPEILDQESEVLSVEGCLSFPGVSSFVFRPYRIFVKYISFPSLEEVTQTLTGFKARLFCHEIDHLNGMLMVDRLNSQESRDEFIRGYKQALRDSRNRKNSFR